jgi:hypothetical protein
MKSSLFLPPLVLALVLPLAPARGVTLAQAVDAALELAGAHSAARLAEEQAMLGYRLLTGRDELPHPMLEPVAAGQALRADHPALQLAGSAADQAREQRERTRAQRRGTPDLLAAQGSSSRPRPSAIWPPASSNAIASWSPRGWPRSGD